MSLRMTVPCISEIMHWAHERSGKYGGARSRSVTPASTAGAFGPAMRTAASTEVTLTGWAQPSSLRDSRAWSVCADSVTIRQSSSAKRATTGSLGSAKVTNTEPTDVSSLPGTASWRACLIASPCRRILPVGLMSVIPTACRTLAASSSGAKNRAGSIQPSRSVITAPSSRWR